MKPMQFFKSEKDYVFFLNVQGILFYGFFKIDFNLLK